MTAGAAAEIADERKKTKYQDLLNSHHFIPLAVETLGPINEEGITLITNIGRHTTRQTDEMRETSFLFQRLSVIIHGFNAVAFAGSLLSQPRCLCRTPLGPSLRLILILILILIIIIK